jgi:hypothetical protein
VAQKAKEAISEGDMAIEPDEATLRPRQADARGEF